MNFDIADYSLADEGIKRIDWADRRMPVLSTIRDVFEKERPFEGVRISATMHVTSETAVLMKTLQAGGAEVVLSASNPLSTQDDVAAALVSLGIPVFAVRGESIDTFYEHLNVVLDTEPHLVFDDGADVIAYLHKQRPDQPIIGALEETTTGVIRLRAMGKQGVLRFPVVAVNDSATKHLFDNRHGTGQSTLDGILRASNILIAGKVVVVAGYGDCGWGVATRAKGMGADTIVVESDPIRALAAVMEGHRVMDSWNAAAEGDVFITVTGDINVFRKKHFDVMKDGAILANSGHFDVEIDVAGLDELSMSKTNIRDELDQFTLPDGRRILLVSEGRLCNLAAAEGHPADVMDMSFADQAFAAEWLLRNHENMLNAVYVLPKDLDEKVAEIKLREIGAGLEILTQEQKDYLSSWEHGT